MQQRLRGVCGVGGQFLDEKALDGELDNGQYIAVGKGTEGWNKVADQETAEAALAKTHELGRRMQKDEAEGRRYEEVRASTTGTGGRAQCR
jgi:hypothetical protein